MDKIRVLRRSKSLASHTEELFGFTLLQRFADLVLLLLDSKFVVARQLDLADSTGERSYQSKRTSAPEVCNAHRLVPPKSSARKVLIKAVTYDH